MKTVEEWAQELPEDVREKFLANVMRTHGGNALKWQISRLSSAIYLNFSWTNSPEGGDFWLNIHDKLKSENR